MLITGTKGSNEGNQARKRNKRNPDWKGRGKTICFADENILYIGKPKKYTSPHTQYVNRISIDV